MTIRIFPIGVAMVLATVVAHAQDQQTMNREAEALGTAAGKKLNVVYKKVMAALDGEGQAALKKAQRAWLVYRDAAPEFQADAMRGVATAALPYAGALERLRRVWRRGGGERCQSFDITPDPISGNLKKGVWLAN